MIHYINNVPVTNIQLQKAKRHALPHYRHMQRLATIKDLLIRTAVTIITLKNITPHNLKKVNLKKYVTNLTNKISLIIRLCLK